MKLCREIIVSLVFSVIYVLFSLVVWLKCNGNILLLLLFLLIGLFIVVIYLAAEFTFYKIKTKTKKKISSQDNFIGFRNLFSHNKFGGEAE